MSAGLAVFPIRGHQIPTELVDCVDIVREFVLDTPVLAGIWKRPWLFGYPLPAGLDSDALGREPDGDVVRRNVSSDDSPGSDHGVASDPATRRDHCLRAESDVVIEKERLGLLGDENGSDDSESLTHDQVRIEIEVVSKLLDKSTTKRVIESDIAPVTVVD